MTGFWVTAALMIVAVVAVVLVPMLRRPKQSGPARAEFDLTVYKDQLAEIERDRERGLLGDTEAEAAIIEIKRRMLKAAEPEDGDGNTEAVSTGQQFLNRPLAAVLAAALPMAALGFYFFLGSPDRPDLPYASRDINAEIQAREGRLQKAEVLQLTGRLVEALKKNPGDTKGWLLLGRTYLTINEFDGALDAFRRATELSGRRPDIAASYAEAIVLSENGRITATAKKLFAEILAAAPFDPKARYYLGLEMAQRGNLMGAIQAWVDMVAVSPTNAPWLADINQQIASAAEEMNIDPATIKPSARAAALALTRGLGSAKSSPLPQSSMPPAASAPAPSSSPSSTPRGPSAADVEAAGQMSAGDRDQMIRGMVQRLADRLKENPDDLAGWQRLAQAYEVLGETAKAEEVRNRIKALTK